MHLAPATSSDTGAGDARKISVAQILVYELRVRPTIWTSKQSPGSKIFCRVTPTPFSWYRTIVIF